MNKQLDRFELLDQIDAGGATTVFRATEHMGQGVTRPAAVKVLGAWNLDDEEQLARLRHEVEFLVALGGTPNIVTILGMGIDEEMGPWIAMEQAGSSLVHSIEDTPAEPGQVRVLLRDVLRAMVSVHGAEPQILHRDLKPQNILSTKVGIWKVADFGLAQRQGAEETMSLATVKYAAPEMLDASYGEESPRLDLYALGMVAYEFALGRDLFRKQFPSIYDPTGASTSKGGDERPKWMYWHTSMQMTLPPIADLVEGYPQDLSDLIASMIAKPMTQRIGTASGALERLGEVGAIAPIVEEEKEDSESRSPEFLRTIGIAAAAAALIAIVGGLLWYLVQGRPGIDLESARFIGQTEVIPVTGKFENFPEAGRAELVVLKGGRRSYEVTLEEDGSSFKCDVRIPALGTFPASLAVKDRRGTRVARSKIELERRAPKRVTVRFVTDPLIEGAKVRLSSLSMPDGGLELKTNENGIAIAKVPFGQFKVSASHPLFEPLPETERQTGIDEEKRLTWSGTRLDPARLQREIRSEVRKLMAALRRKTDCPGGPHPADVKAEIEADIAASTERLQQLGSGNEEIELFLYQVAQVKDCDKSSLPTEPTLVDPASVDLDDPDAAAKLRIMALVGRVDKLLDKKVTCPPGPLDDYEEGLLTKSLDELDTLVAGNEDLELYVYQSRAVNDCDPSSLPDEVDLEQALSKPVDSVAEMKQLKQRIDGLLDKKVNCPPGPLAAFEEEMLVSSLLRLGELGAGNADIELYVYQCGQVKDCDPESLPEDISIEAVTAPEAQPGAEGADPLAGMKRLKQRIDSLLEKKVNCPPGPLDDFEEKALATALDELADLAAGTPEVELYIHQSRNVKDCDPTSLPDEIDLDEVAAQPVSINELAAELRQIKARIDALIDKKINCPPGPLDEFEREQLASSIDRFQELGAGNPDIDLFAHQARSTRDCDPTSKPEAIDLDVIINQLEVDALLEMSLEDFTAFVRRNVPTGVLSVEPVEEIDRVRLHGPLFSSEEQSLLRARLGHGMVRIQSELRIDAWEVCRSLSEALEARGAEGVRVDAYLAAKDPTLFVQFEKGGSLDSEKARELARSYVIDQGLLWVRAYVETPADSLPGDKGADTDRAGE